MNFEDRKNKAIEIAKAKGIAKIHYANPLFGLMWKLGIKIPPPHYIEPFFLAFIFWVPLAPLLTLWIYLKINITLFWAMFWGAISAFFCVLYIAYLYHREKTETGLPNWDEIS